jgi:hypothetical protein
LTLQCFIVADVICFKYCDPFGGSGEDEESQPETPKAGNESNSVQYYYTRINPAEPLWSFLQRLDRSRLDSNALIEGHDIGIADERSSRHHCNTGICFRGPENALNNASLEVSMVILGKTS